jgi:ketosteroid isomerase-like protein
MRKAWICGLLGVLSLGSATWSQAQDTGATEKAVTAMENQWLESQKTNNVDLLAPLLADKLVNTSTEGKVTNRAETLANAKATKFASVEYVDMHVTAFGDTAIATGTFKGKGTDKTGKPFDQLERFTDTWVKMPGGKWQCVATHGSDIKK